MPDFILPSKLISERITVSFEFMEEMEWNETIENAQVTITAVVGVDNTTTEMLYRDVFLTDTEVKQQIQLGEPGVIYMVECSATGTSGTIYVRRAHLAILPDNAEIPPHFGLYLTSRVYPIEDSAPFQHGFEAVEIKLRPMPFPLESFTSALADTADGNLQVLLVSTEAPTESFQHGFDTIPGFLYSSLIGFTAPEESYDMLLSFVSGTLETRLVSYSLAESFDHGLVIISGSLHA